MYTKEHIHAHIQVQTRSHNTGPFLITLKVKTHEKSLRQINGSFFLYLHLKISFY